MNREGMPEKRKPVMDYLGDEWALPTDIDLLEGAAGALEDRLKALSWGEEDIMDVQVGFREALINAIAHGNLGLKKPEGGSLAELAAEEIRKHPEKRKSKKVHVKIDATKDKVIITIRDEGEGFTREEVAKPTEGDGLFKESGRGILMMELYLDSATHNAKGNEITLVKTRKE